MLVPSPVRSVRNLHASSTIACALLFVTAAGVSAARAAEHTLMPSPKTVHIGYFLATVKPVLTIDSGDIVTIESAASVVPSVVDQSGVVPPSAVPQYQRDIYGEVKDRGPGPHILTGPIEIRGAEPGDVLEVRILDIGLVLDWGFNRQRPYTGALPDEFTARYGRASFRSTARPRPPRWPRAWWCRSTSRSSAPWVWRPIRRWAASAAARPASIPATWTTRT